MSPQEKRVVAWIRTSDLTIKRPTLCHMSYPPSECAAGERVEGFQQLRKIREVLAL
jgi:hypothetical protein